MMSAQQQMLDASILLVDDAPANIALLTALLTRAGYTDIRSTTNASEVLGMVRDCEPDIILLDLHMPRLTGFDVLELLHAQMPDREFLPVLVLTADITDAARERALGLGAHDFVSKPFNQREVLLRISNLLRTRALYQENLFLLEQTLTGTVAVLLQLLSTIAPDLVERSQHVRRRARALCSALEVADAWQVELAALLSHVGCISLPPTMVKRVLQGKELSPQEFEQFKAHPEAGAQLVASIPRLAPVAAIIGAQLLPFDRPGAMDAVVPLGARILRAALDYESLQAAGVTPSGALLRMRERPGWYDPAVLDALEAA